MTADTKAYNNTPREIHYQIGQYPSRNTTLWEKDVSVEISYFMISFSTNLKSEGKWHHSIFHFGNPKVKKTVLIEACLLFGWKSSLYKIRVHCAFFLSIGTKEIFVEYLILKGIAAFLYPLTSFFLLSKHLLHISYHSLHL